MSSFHASNFSALKEQLKRYSFIQNGTFFYREPPFGSEVATTLKLKITEINKIWKTLFPDQKFPENKPLTENQLGELLLSQNLDFSTLSEWSFKDICHHFAAQQTSEKIQHRTLIVALLGHVDHGKTTLLDALRSSSIAKKEIGEITQKLSAYTYVKKNTRVTLIDTPGHEFFGAMRKRGAAIADWAILVVSGTEGIKPQTLEAIYVIKKAKIPMIVWINKNDLPNFNIQKTTDELMEHGVIEGENNTVFFEGSAKTKKGLDQLQLFFESETKKDSLKVAVNQPGKAVVLDLLPGNFGSTLALLVISGKISIHDTYLSGKTVNHIKKLEDGSGKSINSILAGEMAIISGFSTTAVPGQVFLIFRDASLAKLILEDQEEQTSKSSKPLDFNFDNLDEEKKKIVKVYVKFGFAAAEEAFLEQFSFFDDSEITLDLVGSGIGIPTLKELQVIKSSNAQLVFFQLNIGAALKKELKESNIIYDKFDLIYKFWQHLKELTSIDKMSLENATITVGSGMITHTFEHSKLGLIAGVVVDNGLLTYTSDLYAIYRDNELIAKNLQIVSMRTLREKVTKVPKGGEVGIVWKPLVEFQIGDRIEQYKIKKNEKK